MTDLSDSIAENAQAPASARGDSGSVAQHPLPAQIDADRYLASRTSVADPLKKTAGVRFGRISPPGAV